MGQVVQMSIAVISTGVITFGLLYITVVTVLGIRQTRKDGVPVSQQEALLDAEPDPDAELHGFAFYFLIPGLNEEEVIGGTITALLGEQPGATVVMIDDGSDDRTAAIVGTFEHTGRVKLLSRTLPHARLGKGKALNNGMDLVRADVARRGIDTSKVIVGVMDADGRMTANATSAVAKEFAADPSVGGLQLVVRIRNRDSLALSFQDMEFWAMSGLGQLGRAAVGSVSMGGNGQFTRLSALDEVGVDPWSESLTEDLDLGISLAVLGWKMTATPWAYVTQQGVGRLGRLVRQRTRWYQGHMLSICRLPELARSRYLPTGRFMELAAYLAVPWAISLPWSVLQQYLLFELITGNGLPEYGTNSTLGRILVGVAWYVVSFTPHVFWGFVYWWRGRTVPLWKGLVMAHLMIPWSYVAHLAAWRALARIILRRNGWTKTSRESEGPPELQGSSLLGERVLTRPTGPTAALEPAPAPGHGRPAAAASDGTER
ncbi:glycosyltransferase family 2 protein [Streptomyces sp. NPDC048637]|uniref:glycosyltransferase family 2 protein n=1 Tax=Streptomyces sp. NPDC048637 TaxID=3155636 RepID=UPI0034132DFD